MRKFAVLMGAMLLTVLPLHAVAQVMVRDKPWLITDDAGAGRPALGAGVQLNGVTVYDPVTLLGFAIDHVTRSGLPATPEHISEAIALVYREDGYPLAEAGYRLDPASGAVVIEVWEGRLLDIRVVGAPTKLASRIEAYLAPALSEQPLRQSTLERALMLATDLAGGSQTSTIDFPETGQGVLVIHVTPRRHGGVAGIERLPLRPGYAVRAYALEEAYGVLTGGDMARVVAAATRNGVDDWSLAGNLSYRAPVGSKGAYVELFGGNAIARREFGQLSSDLRFEGVNAAVVVGYPTRRNIHGFDYLLSELEFSRAESRFVGDPLVSQAKTARLYWLSGHNFDDGGLLRFGLITTIGEGGEGSTGFYDGERRFVHGRGEASLILPLGTGGASTLRIEAHAQLANDPLPAVERFNAGHTPFLRGYAPGEASGDRGVSATIELARDMALGSADRRFAPAIFLSAGRLDSLYPAQFGSDDWTLLSAGIGSDVDLGSGVSASGWVGWPLRDGPRTEAGEPAVYFGLSKSW